MWLRPLPAVPYAPGLKCFERKVLKGDQIRIENLRYNVPWGYTGKMLIICIVQQKPYPKSKISVGKSSPPWHAP